MSATTEISSRVGFPAKERERALWIIGNSEQAFEKIGPLLKILTKQYVRLNIILTATDKKLGDWLAQTYPQFKIQPLPLDNPFSVRMFLSRSNIRAAIILNHIPHSGSSLIKGLARRSIALVHLTKLNGPTPQTMPELENICETSVELVSTEVKQTEAGNRQLTVQQTSDMLGEMLGRDLKQKRDESSLFSPSANFLLKASKHPRRKNLVKWRLLNYADIAELAAALNYPDTIMCLGNGPSSEDNQLTEMPYDALFRVNHSWRQRGKHQNPDVVFTGGRPTMRAVRNAIFGLQTENAERRLVATQFFSLSSTKTRFFNVSSICPQLMQFNWQHLRPTNGASMLAAAVALQPKKLIVAGIDLFQHPDGTYPGDTSTPNEFSPAHSLAAELRFLLELFDTYQGELVIISSILRDHLSRQGNEKSDR